MTVRHTERDSLRDLGAVLELCAAGRIRYARPDQPGHAALITVASALTHGDLYPGQHISSFAWPLLLETAGLAVQRHGVLQLTRSGRKSRARLGADDIRRLWQRWLTSAVIDEFDRISTIEPRRRAFTLTPPTPRRFVVAQALATLVPADDWITVDELFAAMRAQGLSPTVLRSRRALRHMRIGTRASSLGYLADWAATEPDRAELLWNLLEARYTLVVLLEYAATVGLIDIAYTDPEAARDDFRFAWGTGGLDFLSRYDGLRMIRLTPLGRYASPDQQAGRHLRARRKPARPNPVRRGSGDRRPAGPRQAAPRNPARPEAGAACRGRAAGCPPERWTTQTSHNDPDDETRVCETCSGLGVDPDEFYQPDPQLGQLRPCPDCLGRGETVICHAAIPRPRLPYRR